MSTAKKPTNTMTFTIKGKEYSLPLIWVPYEKLELWTKNPRYGYMVSENPALTHKDMLEVLKIEPGTKALRNNVEANGGLAEPIIVFKKGDKYEVREGNRRTAAWSYLYEGGNKSGKDNPWAKMPCYLLGEDQDGAFKSWLAIVHIQGKRPWDSYAKALYAQDMMLTGATEEEVAKDCGLTKAEVNRQKDTVDLLKDYAAATGDTKPQEKFWHCYELANLRKVKEKPHLFPQIFKAMNDGKFGGSKNVRSLKDLVDDKTAFERFVNCDADDKDALADAIEIALDTDPEKTKAFKSIIKATAEIGADMSAVIKHIQKPAGAKMFFKMFDKMVEAARLAGCQDRLNSALRNSIVKDATVMSEE